MVDHGWGGLGKSLDIASTRTVFKANPLKDKGLLRRYAVPRYRECLPGMFVGSGGY